MADPTCRATYADLQAVPEHLIGEIIDGVLETSPRPPRQGAAVLRLMAALGGDGDQRLDGVGGWSFLYKPELHFQEEIVVPDRAGWHGDRFPFSGDAAFVTVVPDWVCEIRSPSTARPASDAKLRAYAEGGVQHLWLLDTASGVLEAFVLVGRQWLLLATIRPGEMVDVAPFEAHSFPLNNLFPFDTPPSPEA